MRTAFGASGAVLMPCVAAFSHGLLWRSLHILPILKILTIVGTRPEAIKMAPVVLELKRRPNVEHVFCATAQHRQMLDQVTSVFGLTPDIDLDIMRPNQSLEDLNARMLIELSRVISDVRPDWVLVQGDTTTVLAGAIAAFYQKVKVGHVEAGLRSFDLAQPFPEEMNRRMTSVVTTAHFAPTPGAMQNLLREGVSPDSVFVTGNPVVDALQIVAARPDSDELPPGIPTDCRLLLVTCHRRENFGAPLQEILNGLLDVLDAVPDAHIVYPVHPNPNVAAVARSVLCGHDRVTLLEPLDYVPLVALMKRAELVITDSGGIQEEAPGLGKPVLVLREVTERPEAVVAGAARLVGASRERIREEAVVLLEDRIAYETMAQAVNPYGDGRAASRIAAVLVGEPFVPFEATR